MAKSLLKKVEESNYTDLESIKALDYLHKFNSEFHKNVVKKGDKSALHRSKKLRRDCYARENARNRDVLSMRRDRVVSLEIKIRRVVQEKFTGEEKFMADSHLFASGAIENPENILIEILDGKKGQV